MRFKIGSYGAIAQRDLGDMEFALDGRPHLAAMAALEAIGVPRELPPVFQDKLTEVTETLVENADQLQMQELWLFGSAARGDFTATSDLDFLVLTTSEREREISLKVEALEVRDDVGYPNVDVIVRNLRSLGDESYAVFNNAVKRDKIVLWERGMTVEYNVFGTEESGT